MIYEGLNTLPASEQGAIADTIATGELAQARPSARSAERESRRRRLAEKLFGVEQEPARLGRFVLLERLGEGGVGTVHIAYDPQLDRRVALKLLRTGYGGSSPLRARLLREAQALARLSHPNVVPVHDAGVVDDQVFIVMEYVRGRTLRRWADEARPSWREVLAVYLQAGRGLAAAHASGVIHRDFKPDNAVRGDDGRVRVLDFGLARDLDAEELTTVESSSSFAREPATLGTSSVELEQTQLAGPSSSSRGGDGAAVSARLTVTGAVMGTPAYMAPEQFRGAETDARTDQFSFCASLWEALYGDRPFAGDSIQQLAEAVVGGELRGPPAGARVPGWLHQTITRGLAVSPDERWRSMDELLTALDRDPTRRRALGVGVGVLLAGVATTALVSEMQRERAVMACTALGSEFDEVWSGAARAAVEHGLKGTGVNYAAATAARVLPRLDDYAEEWKRTRAELCRATTIEGRWTAEAVSSSSSADREDAVPIAEQSLACLDEGGARFELLLGALSRPGDAAAGASVVQRAVQAASGLPRLEVCLDEARLRHRPAPPKGDVARAEVRRIRALLSDAATQAAIGRYERGMALAEEAQRGADALEWAPLRAAAALRRGELAEELGRYADAEVAIEESFFLAGESGAEEVYVDAARARGWVVGSRQARHKEGLRWARLGQLLLDRAGVDAVDLRRVRLLTAQGSIHREAGELEAAKRHYERALTIAERALGEDHLEVAAVVSGLGIVYKHEGDYARARLHEARALAIAERALGPAHPDVARLLSNLGVLDKTEGEYEDARRRYERALSIEEEALGPEHPDVSNTLLNLGVVAKHQGALGEARRYYARALKIRERALGPEHLRVAAVLNNLGNVYVEERRLDEAQTSFERALKIREKSLGATHPELGATLNNLANVSRSRGDYAGARARYERALQIVEEALGRDHPRYAFTLNNLGNVFKEEGRYDDARARYEGAAESLERALGPEHPNVAIALLNVAMMFRMQGDYDAAEARMLRVEQIFDGAEGREHPARQVLLYELGELYRLQGRGDEARDHFERSRAFAERLFGAESGKVAMSLTGIGVTLVEQGRHEQARAPLERALANYRSAEADPADEAETSFALARALWPERSQRARARELATGARDGYREAGARWTRERAEVEAWLKRRGR